MGGIPIPSHHHARSDDISAIFKAGLEAKINEITQQVIHDAEQQLRRRINEITIAHALEFSSHLDVVHARNELTIRLRNNTPNSDYRV